MKRSIKKQIALTFIVVITGIVILCFLANFLFLKSYYIYNKKLSIIDIYKAIQTASENDYLNDEDFLNSLSDSCNINNISMIVLDDVNQSILSIGEGSDFMFSLLMEPHKNDVSYEKISENYIIRKVFYEFNKREYLQMAGVLDNDFKFLIICPLEPVEDSVYVANTFLFYIGILSILAGIIFTIIISRSITKPIVELSNISSKMANLDFSEKYESKNKNEMDILGENINFMSDKLENTISELKSANANLIKDIKQKEEIEDMRKEFTSNVSHELKTPIALIQSYAEGLKEGIIDDDDSRDYYLDVILDEANKMNHLVKQLMSLSELEFGNNQISIERVDIAELIANHISINEPIFKQNDIEVIYKNAGEHIFVWTDEYRTEQVVRNYLSNAIHYCINDKKIVIGIESFEDVARINIFNTGNHISDEDITKIWDKFYKADKARSRDYGGSGVGLSLIKAIMESFNMKYGVENVEDGVNFYFELPFK